MEAPIRQYQLKATIAGDTIEDVIHALKQIAFDLKTTNSKQSVSGGVNSGWFWEIRHDPEMNHDAYVEKVHAYLHYLEQQRQNALNDMQAR